MFDIPYKKRRVENKTPLDSQLSICKDSVFYKLYDIIEAIFGSFSTKKTPTPKRDEPQYDKYNFGYNGHGLPTSKMTHQHVYQPIIGIPITRIPATDIATVTPGELPTVAQLTAGSIS